MTKKKNTGSNAGQAQPKLAALPTKQGGELPPNPPLASAQAQAETKPGTEEQNSGAPTALKAEEPSKPAKKAEPDAEAKPAPAKALFVLTRIEQARALQELPADQPSKPATEDRTEILAFKTEDGRTLHVVTVNGTLYSQEK